LALAGPRLDPQLRQRIQLLLRGPDAGERRGP
jgi:hypothetical protein